MPREHRTICGSLPPQETNRLGQTAIEGGPCSACHLSHSFAKDLAVSPLDPEGYCLPCHSAYHVAEHHARTTMQHPEARCRECHDPHDATHAEFLAAPPEDICVNCHTGYDDGPAGGMHPVGLTNVDIPPSLQVVESDAHTAMLTCATCHDTHEAPHGTLLRITTASNELCLECHADKLLEHADDGMLPRHGQQPRLDDTQLALVERWGRPVGTGGKLLCVSCHNVHGAVRESQLLAFRPKYGETCGACHPAHEGVVGSPHDMRIDHADLANSAGLLPTEAGVCSPCHMAHQFPRERVATTGDPAGQCISCHRDGDCGQHTYTGLRDHPETSCIDCHDPHVRTFGSFLKAEPARLCAQCHPDHQRLRGGPHDVLTGRGPWPAEATKSQDACLSCHLPHGGTRDDLFRFRVPTGAGNHDGVCLSCHEDAAWQVDSTKAAIHPRTIDPAHAKVDLALVPTDSTGEKRMGCRTCHDPHGGATPTYLARVPIGEDTQRLCVHCHTSKRLTRFTGHSSASLRAAGYEADSCKPCHAMHAKPNDQWGRLLSPRFLMEIRPAATGQLADCLPCVACHATQNNARQRTFEQHPLTVTKNTIAPDEPGYMPLFDQQGLVDPHGQVTCRTCHVSHGRVDLLEQIEQQTSATSHDAEGLKAHLRPFESPNICIGCHGNQARALFLFFHDPSRRSGPDEIAPRSG